VQLLDTPTPEMLKQHITHAIGQLSYPAPQATLMATLVKGIQSHNLDWQFVIVGVFIALTMELCDIKALAFAIGLYLPLSTTLPIFAGGAVKGYIDWRAERKKEKKEDGELGRGSLFATGLIAGGALTGVIVAILSVFFGKIMTKISVEEGLTTFFGIGGYQVMGTLFFVAMMVMLYRLAIKKSE